ncbi:protein-glutamate methylesterase/protein-glutamine glutaminase [Roseospira navarrensis]|uniref:Protein-glutamate methylesterase/protein-glutamine glutaminase n=1 Tax=Roseospira navarrensis TaxID=140058 RepID=A0A7X1ZF65_9PROT|nr:chemotaxis response regulator protein-glutamate methylesterase [Roseospira navarrensis]MQX37454.1 chemotaxis-specific protein-glutamate methyltransferase CheB [Roseospira navarrensis]
MIVDDSAVVRGLESRMLSEDPNITVVASVSNGQLAVQALERHDIEVIVLDIEMPVLDGLSALPKLLARNPNLKIIMASTLTLRNAEISLQALQAGAADYVPKPVASREITGESEFKRDLVAKVRALGAAHRRESRFRRGGAAPAPATPTRARGGAPAAPTARAPGQARPAATPTLRPAPTVVLRRPPRVQEAIDVIAIGSSTGGPQALFTVLGGLKAAGGVRQPVLITQHMPATFTTILAGHISRASGMEAHEAKDGETIVGGHVYVAPGDYHMVVDTKGANRIIRLNQDPPENFCRPAVDPMFRSVARVYGRRVLGVVLTGMGSDGTKGGAMIVEAGGTIVAQDEATSVVWGMPGAIAQAGLCTAVLPVGEIGPYISKIASKR